MKANVPKRKVFQDAVDLISPENVADNGQAMISVEKIVPFHKGIEWRDIVEKLNKISWSFDNELWFNLLVISSANKKMITGKEAVRGVGTRIPERCRRRRLLSRQHRFPVVL